jgi:hypothetical protein
VRNIVLLVYYSIILNFIIVWIFYLSIKVTSQVVQVFFYLLYRRHVSLTGERNFILNLSTHSVHFESMLDLISEVNPLVFISSRFITLDCLFLRHLRYHYLPTERKKK